jgi:hypothetical protein
LNGVKICGKILLVGTVIQQHDEQSFLRETGKQIQLFLVALKIIELN